MNRNNKEFRPEGEDEIGEMLSALPRVSAPANFEMHLKARIARRSTPSRSGFYSAMKVAAPASLLVAIAGFLFFSGVVMPDLKSVVTVAESEAGSQPPVRVSEQIPASDFVASNASDTSVASDTNRQVIASKPVPSGDDVAVRPAYRAENSLRRAAPVPATDTNSGGGSARMAVRVDRPVKQNSTTETPRMSSPDKIAPGFERNSTVPVTDVLELLGIDALYDDGWQVRSVDAVRAGARSGVKAGDVITALDGKAVVERSTLLTGTTVRTVTVKRGETTVTLALRN